MEAEESKKRRSSSSETSFDAEILTRPMDPKRARYDDNGQVNDAHDAMVQAYAAAFGQNSSFNISSSVTETPYGTRYGATAILQPAPVLKHVYTVEDAYSSSELAKAAVRRLAVQHQAIESLKQVFDSLPTGLKSGVNGTMASATASSSAAQLPPTAPKVPRGSPPAEGSSTSNAQTDIANPIGTLHEAAQKHPSIPLPIYDFTDTGQVLICSLTIPLAGQPLVFREEVVYNTNKPSTKRMKEAVSRSAIHKGVLDILNNDSRQKTSLLLTQRIQTPAAPYVPVASSSALPRPPLTPTASASSHLFDNIPNPVGKIMEALQAAGKSTNMIAFVSTQDTVFGVPMFGCKIDVDGSTRYIQEATCKSKKEAKDFAARRALNEGVLELIRARPRTASERLGKISMPAQQAWLTAPKDPDDALGVKGPLQSRATPKVVESAAQRASVIGNGSAVADAPPASETMKRLERICVDKLGENKITYEIRTDPRSGLFGAIANLRLARTNTKQYRSTSDYTLAETAQDAAAKAALEQGVVERIETFVKSQKVAETDAL